MTLTSSVQRLPASAHSLPRKLGLTLWSGCQRVTSFRSTRTALFGSSISPDLWNQQHCSVQSPGRPRHLHCNAQPLIATRITTPLPQTLIPRTRRLHSGSASFDQPCSDEIASSKGGVLPCLVALLLLSSPILYWIGRKRGAQDLLARLPEGKIFTERENLQKEEEKLDTQEEGCIIFQHECNILRNRRKKLAEKVEALDKEELENFRQRAMVLEGKLQTRKASIETDRARESQRESVNAGILPDKTHTERVDGLSSETAELRLHGPSVGIPSLGIKEEYLFRCPDCGEKADPSVRQAEMLPSANVVPQVPSQGLEMNETPRNLPHQDDSMTHTKADTKLTAPPTTMRGPSSASNIVLESLSAENDATNEEMCQIKRVKEALKSRERELEAQGKDRKKRIQELNAPKSDQISHMASGMLLGSALTFGVKWMMSVYRS